MNDWWKKNGVRFECQGSGKCCVSHGEYGNVWMTAFDRKRMAKVVRMSTAAFTRKHCEKASGMWRLKEDTPTGDCRFLEGKRCGVYEGRPTQCRTWPFWPEVMNPKIWKKEVASFCPGIGKGRVWDVEEIQKILDEQTKSETALARGR